MWYVSYHVMSRMWIAGVATDKLQNLEGSNRPVFNIVTMVGNISSGLGELKARQQALLAVKTERANVGV